MRRYALPMAILLLLSASIACTRTNNTSYKDNVHQALEQADLKGLNVDEDRDRNTITLTGKLHSEDAKNQAAQVAQSAGGGRIIVNQVSVEPVGQEADARKIESNVDDGIEKNYKAALISNGLDKQSIRFSSKNGVITLKGRVKSHDQREQAEKVAASVPNVAQVVNELDIRR